MLAEHISKNVLTLNLSQIPESATQQAKQSILDGLAAMVAGSATPVGHSIIRFISSCGGAPESKVIPTDLRCPVALAALAMGTMGHALDYDDSSISLAGHPTTTILPAALAAGDKMEASGREVLIAFVAGVETACKIGRMVNPDHFNRGFHPTSTIGVFGATVAAGRLLKLSEEELSYGLGIAGSLSSGLQVNFGTLTKPLHAGFAAQHGVVSAILAKEGVTSSKSIFEGNQGFFKAFVGKPIDPSQITHSIGIAFDLVNPGMVHKLYPSCSRTQAAIHGLLELVNKYGISPDQIASIECGTDEKAPEILNFPKPRTEDEGKFSMQFCLALAAANRKVSISDFCRERLDDPKIAELMDKIKMFIDPKIVDLGQEKRLAVSLNVKLVNGKEYVVLHFPKGFNENPILEDELIRKYRNCVGLVLNEEKVEQSLELVLNLERIENIRNLTCCFVSEAKSG